MLPDYPKYKTEIRQFMSNFFNIKVKEYSSGLFGGASHRVIYEGDFLESKYSDDFTYSREMEKIETGETLSKEGLINHPEIVLELMDKMAKEVADRLGKNALNMVDELTKITGNIDLRTGKFTVQDYIAMLAKMPLEFREDGLANIPTLFAGPHMIEEMSQELKKIVEDPQVEETFGKMIEVKRQEWYEREVNRKLVD